MLPSIVGLYELKWSVDIFGSDACFSGDEYVFLSKMKNECVYWNITTILIQKKEVRNWIRETLNMCDPIQIHLCCRFSDI